MMQNNNIFQKDADIENSQIHPHCVERHAHGWEVDVNELTPHKNLVSIEAFHTPKIQLSHVHYTDAIMIQGATLQAQWCSPM